MDIHDFGFDSLLCATGSKDKEFEVKNFWPVHISNNPLYLYLHYENYLYD